MTAARKRAPVKVAGIDDPKLAELEVDLLGRKATRDGRRLELTAKEFELLHRLMKADGAVVSDCTFQHIRGLPAAAYDGRGVASVNAAGGLITVNYSATSPQRANAKIDGDTLMLAFGGDAEHIGELQALARSDLHGNYSPARWMVVAETADGFVLRGEGLSTFKLPASIWNPAERGGGSPP